MYRREQHRRTAICSICNQLARPVVDHLCFISTCNHVFHHLCLMQQCQNRPLKTKPRCPACMKEFASMRCIKPLLFQSPGSASNSDSNIEDEPEGMRKTVRKLREKLSDQEASLKQQSHQLCVLKERAETAEAEKEKLQKENKHAEWSFQMELEDLTRKAVECPKIQARVVEMEKVIALHKLMADIDLSEEDMAKIQTFLGDRMSHNNMVYVLKKSLTLRNQQLKETKVQNDLLAKEAKRTCRKLAKAKEKVHRLETRVEELEKKTTLATPKVGMASKMTASISLDPKAQSEQHGQETLGTILGIEAPPVRKQMYPATASSQLSKKAKYFS